MKFFRLDLLTLLISLFILNSCKNQDTVGLGVNSTSQLSNNLIDTSTIIINTVHEDSVITSGVAKNSLAYFTDPIFGTTVASIATDLNLPGSTGYTPPTGTITIDSARLVMNYANGFYGDSITSTYTVDVFQLKTKYNAGIVHSNRTQYSYNSVNLLGSLTFNARPNDSLKIFNIIAGAPDTLIKVPPQIRIPIDKNFINLNLFNASSTVIGTNAVFQNIVKGLYLTIDKSKSTGAGGILLFQPTDTLAVYYRSVSGTTIDTAVVLLPIANMASTIQHTYTTTINTELADSTTSRNTFYLQGLGGLRARVKFPNLLKNFRNNLLKKDSDVVIDRAEVVITPSPGTFIPYSPIPRITMYQLDIAGQRIFLQDANSGVDPRSGGIGVFGGFYGSAQNEYHFIITAYLQDLLLGKTVDYGTYIGPVDNTNTTSVDIAATPQVASRTAAVGSDKSSPYRIKLNIIYTKVAKQ
jgi:hypothetical protein